MNHLLRTGYCGSDQRYIQFCYSFRRKDLTSRYEMTKVVTKQYDVVVKNGGGRQS